jgi:hypothetical protein
MLVKKGVNDTQITSDPMDLSKNPILSTTDFIDGQLGNPGIDSDSDDSQDSGPDDNAAHEIESQILPSNEKEQ